MKQLESLIDGLEPVVLLKTGAAIGFIVLASWLVLLVARKLIRKGFGVAAGDVNQRANLAAITYSLARYVVFIVAGLLIIQVLFPDFNLGPLLAGAGVLGVVLGLGVQAFFRDVMSGFLVNFEDQLRVGDYVTINDVVTGTVEEVGLRLTTLREWAGRKVYFPNSEIKTVRNYNRGEMRVIVAATFPFEVDPAAAREAMNAVSRTVLARFADDYIRGADGTILEPPQVLGVTDINQNGRGGEYTIVARVKPRRYWEIERAIREEIWAETRRRGLPLAYARWVLDRRGHSSLGIKGPCHRNNEEGC